MIERNLPSLHVFPAGAWDRLYGFIMILGLGKLKREFKENCWQCLWVWTFNNFYNVQRTWRATWKLYKKLKVSKRRQRAQANQFPFLIPLPSIPKKVKSLIFPPLKTLSICKCESNRLMMNLYHETRLGLKKYRMMNSSRSYLVTFPFLFLSMIWT